MTTDPSPTASEAAGRPPLIAVLGARRAGKRALVTRLVEGGGAGEGIRGAPAPPSPGRAPLAARPWTIDTKYYSAAVEVAAFRLERDGGHEAVAEVGEGASVPGAHATTSPAALATAAEAVVLVFDAGDEASFEAARAWAQAAGPALDAVGVRLAVATKADAAGLGPGGAPRPAWHGPAGEWAAGAGLEWVDAAAGAPAGVEEAALLLLLHAAGAGADEDGAAAGPAEAVGSARVREALAAHMWPGLVRKPPPAAGRGGGGGGGGGGGRAAATAATATPPSALPDVDDDGDDGFASLLAEATAARDRIRGLPDAERRAAAAAFASRLLAAVGGGGEEASSDDDSN